MPRRRRRSLEAPIQCEFIRRLDARWPGIERQASAAGAHLVGGGRQWLRLQESGVEAGDLDVNIREKGRRDEPGLFIEMKSKVGQLTGKQRKRIRRLKARGY
eukprot:3129576-Prymnesium_polylepis.1